MTIKERKYINNAPKFDIGKNLMLSTGRQSTTTVNPMSFTSNGAYSGYDSAASAYNKSILPLTLSTLTGTAGTIGSLASNFTTQTAANAANVATANSLNAAAVAAGNAAPITEEVIKAGGKELAKGVAGAGGSAANAGLSAAGYVAGAAGTAYGLYNMFSGALNYKNRIHDTEMLAGSSSSTLSKFGRTYKQIGGFDENGILNVTDAQNKADTTNMAMSGLSTGLSAGATIGSIFPGYGNIIGGAIGALIGGIGGWLWGDSEAEERERRVKLDIANTKEAIGGYNAQSESEAGSAGLRDMFNARSGNSNTGILRADKGKVPGYTNGKISGYMSPDETGYDPTKPIMEQTFYPGSPDPNVKEKRIDNKELHGNIDYLSVFGHTDAGGKYYADLARPFGKRAEQVKEEYYNEKDPSIRANLMQEMNFINKNMAALALIQLDDMERKQMKHTLNYKRINADKGKTPRFANGKLGDYLWPSIGAGLQLANLTGYKNFVNSQSPQLVLSAYVKANTTPYLNALARMREDPSNELRELNTAARQSIYNTNQSAGLSGGQKTMLTNNAIKQLFSSRGKILADYAKRNIGYKQAWANAGIQAQQSAAAKALQANQELINAWRQAVGADNNLKASIFSNTPPVLGSIMQAFNSAKNQSGMMDLWNKKADTDRMAIVNNTGNKTTVPTISTTVQKPYTAYTDAQKLNIYNTYLQKARQENAYQDLRSNNQYYIDMYGNLPGYLSY